VGIFSSGLWSNFGWRCHADSRSTEEAKPALETNWYIANIKKSPGTGFGISTSSSVSARP
jgi:hypothetical protein